QVGVGVALRPQRDLTDHLDAVLVPQVVRIGRGQDLVADDDLHDAAGVAQVEEGDSTVVPSPGDPPGQGDLGAGVFGAQGPGVVRANQKSFPSGMTDRPSGAAPPILSAGSTGTLAAPGVCG